MDHKKFTEFVENSALKLKELIFELGKSQIQDTSCFKVEDLQAFLMKTITSFLAERRELAPKILEIIPDFNTEEFAELLNGELEVGDKIEIRSPQCLITSIVEELRIISNIKTSYKH